MDSEELGLIYGPLIPKLERMLERTFIWMYDTHLARNEKTFRKNVQTTK
jgi:hypothetical protein